MLGGVSAARLDPPGTTLSEFFVEPGVSVTEVQPCEQPVVELKG